jgi:hypothetical protein
MRIINFSLALAEREQTAEPTLRPHAGVDAKDNFEGGPITAGFYNRTGIENKKKGGNVRVTPWHSQEGSRLKENRLTHHQVSRDSKAHLGKLHRNRAPHFSHPLRGSLR